MARHCHWHGTTYGTDSRHFFCCYFCIFSIKFLLRLGRVSPPGLLPFCGNSVCRWCRENSARVCGKIAWQFVNTGKVRKRLEFPVHIFYPLSGLSRGTPGLRALVAPWGSLLELPLNLATLQILFSREIPPPFPAHCGG